MNANELAAKFLSGRQSAYISAKQARWLADVVKRELGIRTPEAGRYAFGSFEMKVQPNGAAALTQVSFAEHLPALKQAEALVESLREANSQAQKRCLSEGKVSAEDRSTMEAYVAALEEAKRLQGLWAPKTWIARV